MGELLYTQEDGGGRGGSNEVLECRVGWGVGGWVDSYLFVERATDLVALDAVGELYRRRVGGWVSLCLSMSPPPPSPPPPLTHPTHPPTYPPPAYLKTRDLPTH